MRRALGGLAVAVTIGVGALIATLQPPHATVAKQGIVLEGVALVEPTRRRIADRVVRIEHGRIAEIAPSPPGGAGEWAGYFALPGLIDLHVHHPPPLAIGEDELYALLFLRHGVTSVRDMGSTWPRGIRDHARRIAGGERAGPRVFACGPFVDGPHAFWPGALKVGRPDEADAAVEHLITQGYDCLKLYNGLDTPTTRALIGSARARGLRVVGHVPWEVALEQLSGVEVQHLMGVPRWAGLPDDAIERYVQQSQHAGLEHTPTLVAFEWIAPVGAGLPPPTPRAGAWLPHWYADTLWQPRFNPIAGLQLAHPERLATMQRLVRALHAAGVPVLAGTDPLNPGVVPGASLARELELLVESGLSTEEALASATILAGERLPLERLGRIEPGAPADLALFEADPTQDLANLSTLRAVVADGRLYRIPELDRELREMAAHFQGVPYAPLSGALARVGLRALSTIVD